jgi:hypothetical protein
VLFTEYNKYLLALARGVVPVKPTSDGMVVVHCRRRIGTLPRKSSFQG